jgi:cobalt-zinc-cadmium efflux system membrane fusion protein
MNRLRFVKLSLCLGLGILIVLSTGCAKNVTAQEKKTEGTGPAPLVVEPDLDPNNFKVAHAEQFPLVEAVEYRAAPELNVTGVVNPDVSQQVPVPSLATGKIVEIDARLGDTVKQGQILFKVRSSDVAGAFSDYRKAVKNEELARMQLNRAKILFDDGAIPKSSVEIAQNVEDNALVDLDTTTEHLRLIGSDLNHPTGIVEVPAPVAGIISDQQITTAAGVTALALPAPFTISDVSHVWIICDVFENQMAQVHLGEYADIHLVAYPDRLLKARISNILPAIDPNIRTAKVRLEVENPNLMRLGMFVTATFHGETAETRASVPSTAILHLRDREWVYTPLQNGRFRRLEVVAGTMLPGNMQEVITGLKPGEQVVRNALVFQNTVEQ